MKNVIAFPVNQGASPKPANLIAKVREALAELKTARAQRTEAGKNYQDKRIVARDLVVELHGTRPYGATTAWTADQAGCSQRLVQQFLKEADADDPEAEHDALKGRNNTSQRGRRARQRGGAKMPGANDSGDVIRGSTTPPVTTPETMPETDRLATAKAAAEALSDDEIAVFDTWFTEYRRNRGCPGRLQHDDDYTGEPGDGTGTKGIITADALCAAITEAWAAYNALAPEAQAWVDAWLAESDPDTFEDEPAGADIESLRPLCADVRGADDDARCRFFALLDQCERAALAATGLDPHTAGEVTGAA